MTTLRELARPEIVQMRGYTAASYDPALGRLNANETTVRLAADTSERGLNWYPVDRSPALVRELAALFDQPAERIMVTRGTSEAIDLLIRAFCRPGNDTIVVCPPTFGMYAVYAEVQATSVREVPLTTSFDLDTNGIAAAVDAGARIVFVTSPNNPTGNAMSPSRLDAVVAATRARSLLVIDAAYHEFAATEPPQVRYADEPHVVVLRTLSKAYALAGARCGVLIGDPFVHELTRKIMAPYALATPVVEALLSVLASDAFAERPAAIDALRTERGRVRERLSGLSCVRQVFPSEANFLLAEFADAQAALAVVQQHGYLIRDFSQSPRLPGCLRITIGERHENDAVLRALEQLA